MNDISLNNIEGAIQTFGESERRVNEMNQKNGMNFEQIKMKIQILFHKK